MLFNRQLLNGSQDFFFHFNIFIFIYFSEYKNIETHARAFLPLNISAVGSVLWLSIKIKAIYFCLNERTPKVKSSCFQMSKIWQGSPEEGLGLIRGLDNLSSAQWMNL